MVQVHKLNLAVTLYMRLHIILKQMGTNHGFHSKLVNRIYKHSSGLKETDNILYIMRDAAQE